MVNLTNLLLAIWDYDKSTKKKKNTKNNKAKGLIIKCQMMNLKKNQFSIKDCYVGR